MAVDDVMLKLSHAQITRINTLIKQEYQRTKEMNSDSSLLVNENKQAMLVDLVELVKVFEPFC